MIDPVEAYEAANDLNETRSCQRWQDGKALRMEQAEELAMRALSKTDRMRNKEEYRVMERVLDSLCDFADPLIVEFFSAKYSPNISMENKMQMIDARVQIFEGIEAIAHKAAAEIVDARL